MADQHNNVIGRIIGREAKNDEDIRRMVREALERGDLITDARRDRRIPEFALPARTDSSVTGSPGSILLIRKWARVEGFRFERTRGTSISPRRARVLLQQEMAQQQRWFKSFSAWMALNDGVRQVKTRWIGCRPKSWAKGGAVGRGLTEEEAVADALQHISSLTGKRYKAADLDWEYIRVKLDDGRVVDYRALWRGCTMPMDEALERVEYERGMR